MALLIFRRLLEKNVSIWTSDAFRYNLENILRERHFKRDEIEFAKRQAKTRYYEHALDILKKYENLILEGKTRHSRIEKGYGHQRRNFRGIFSFDDGYPYDFTGVDQIEKLENDLKQSGNSRRNIVTAWNPHEIEEQKVALPPCHNYFEVLKNEDCGSFLDLKWNQRSCDCILGLPFNILSYGFLLNLLAHNLDLKSGRLVGSLGDTHIYEHHIDAAYEIIEREKLLKNKENLTLEIYNKKPSIVDY